VSLCELVWVCVSLCESVWVCVSLCESVWVCVSLCEFVWVCVSLCESVWVCVSLCVCFLATTELPHGALNRTWRASCCGEVKAAGSRTAVRPADHPLLPVSERRAATCFQAPRGRVFTSAKTFQVNSVMWDLSTSVNQTAPPTSREHALSWAWRENPL